MRHVQIQLSRADADRVLAIADDHGAASPLSVEARGPGDRVHAVVFADVPNSKLGRFVAAVSDAVDDAHFVVLPQGSLPITTPLAEVREQVKDVSRRSTLEVELGALQSIGSWPGLLVYAVLSGIVAAYGVIFDTGYLLVAAMLIAPMGAPAMVCVIGATVGDWRMVRRGAGRFWASVLVLAAAAVALGYGYRLDFSTTLMEQISNLSAYVVLLGVGGGAAGAQALVRSDRDSLVSGTATGFLVAVSLSPPSAVLGLALKLQRWDYVAQMSFLVGLTFVGIIAGGWLSLVLLGMGPQNVTSGERSTFVRRATAAAAIALTAAAVGWQITRAPGFRKADLTRSSVSLVRETLRDERGLRLLEASTHFTRSDLAGMDAEALLVAVEVQPLAGSAWAALPRDSLTSRVRRLVDARLRAQLHGVEPFVNVTAYPPAEASLTAGATAVRPPGR